LQVNPGEIRQVFGNLISNALDAIGDRGGRLLVRCFESSDRRTGAKGVRFAFSDSGDGMPKTVIPKIFEAFYTTKEAKGSGIGLWLSAEIVGKHHGKIRLRTRTSGLYRGTLIDVFLPR
jgi:signal transduction histidine kinase